MNVAENEQRGEMAKSSMADHLNQMKAKGKLKSKPKAYSPMAQQMMKKKGSC